MRVILAFSDGDAFEYESKYTTIEKVIYDIQTKRFIEHNGMYYLTTNIVKIGLV